MRTIQSNATRRATSHRRRRREAGFSLVELVMALAVGVILAAVAVPAVTNGVQYFRVRSAVSSLTGAIHTLSSHL